MTDRRRTRPAGGPGMLAAGIRKGGARTAAAVLLLAGIFVGAVGLLVDDDLQLRVKSRLYPLKYEKLILEAADEYGVDPYLVAAVAKAESGFDRDARSSVGAVGLMQLMPDTAEWIQRQPDWRGGVVADLTEAEGNLHLGAYYLAFLTELFDGDVRMTLAAYNAGQGNVAGWLRDAGTPDTLGAEDIPFPETREFVDRVEKLRRMYRELHPGVFVT